MIERMSVLIAIFLLATPALLRAATPGLDVLVKESTDVVLVEVLATNPVKAIEGTRDNVQLKVIQSLKGNLQKDEVFHVYYHLLWADTKDSVLEEKKFEKGKKYVVFLQATRGTIEDKEQMEYSLTDRWLSVLGEHPDLIKRIKEIMAEVSKVQDASAN